MTIACNEGKIHIWDAMLARKQDENDNNNVCYFEIYLNIFLIFLKNKI